MPWSRSIAENCAKRIGDKSVLHHAIISCLCWAASMQQPSAPAIIAPVVVAFYSSRRSFFRCSVCHCSRTSLPAIGHIGLHLCPYRQHNQSYDLWLGASCLGQPTSAQSAQKASIVIAHCLRFEHRMPPPSIEICKSASTPETPRIYIYNGINERGGHCLTKHQYLCTAHVIKYCWE